MSGRKQFAVVDQPDQQAPAAPDPAVLAARQEAARQQAMATQMLVMATQALGQRFVVALSNLFTAAQVAAALWLWYTVLPNPSILQLVGLGMFAVFVLAIEHVRRK